MDSLDKLLDVDPDLAKAEKELFPETQNMDIVKAGPTPVTDKELEDDFQFARKQLKELISNVRGAIDSAVQTAQAGDSPKAYEAVGKVLDSLVAANHELIEIHRTKKETTQAPTNSKSAVGPSPEGQPLQIQNAVFVGHASDLLRELKRIEKAQQDTDVTIDVAPVEEPVEHNG